MDKERKKGMFTYSWIDITGKKRTGEVISTTEASLVVKRSPDGQLIRLSIK